MASTYEKLNRVKERLRTAPSTVDDLARGMGVDNRTIFRYLKIIENENCGLQKTRLKGREQQYYLSGTAPLIPHELLTSLTRMGTELGKGGNHRYAKLIQGVLAHIRPDKPQGEPLPEAISVDPDFVLDHGPLSEFESSEKMVEKLLTSIRRGQHVAIKYAGSNGEVRELVMEPVKVVLRIGKLYLLGYEKDDENRVVLSLLIRRISQMILQNSFFPPSKFDVEGFYRYCYGQWVPRDKSTKPIQILLELRDSWVERLFIESHFNPPAKIRKGNPFTIAELRLYHTPDLESWLLGLAPNVRVLEPATLRQALVDRIKNI